MHIRRDWQKWLVPTASNKRITAVCGAKTSEKYAGIPGVSDQRPFYSTDGKTGCCIHCCGKALDKFNELFEQYSTVETSSIVKNQYVTAAQVMMNQILVAQMTRPLRPPQ
jgi:hypothetical protein